MRESSAAVQLPASRCTKTFRAVRGGKGEGSFMASRPHLRQVLHCHCSSMRSSGCLGSCLCRSHCALGLCGLCCGGVLRLCSGVYYNCLRLQCGLFGYGNIAPLALGPAADRIVTHAQDGIHQKDDAQDDCLSELFRRLAICRCGIWHYFRYIGFTERRQRQVLHTSRRAKTWRSMRSYVYCAVSGDTCVANVAHLQSTFANPPQPA